MFLKIGRHVINTNRIDYIDLGSLAPTSPTTAGQAGKDDVVKIQIGEAQVHLDGSEAEVARRYFRDGRVPENPKVRTESDLIELLSAR
jgi:hypothetical protein